MGVKKGDKVKVEYKGTLKDGTVFDSSEKHGEPLEFEVGCGQIIPGFEKAILGKEKGDKVEVKLEACDAYGDPDPSLIKDLPRERLGKEEVSPGMVLMMVLPDGVQISARIVKVTEETVTCDLNHPLAGKVLCFSIEIVEICE